MADDFGGHDPVPSTLPYTTANPAVIQQSPEKNSPSRQSTMRSKGGMEAHASGATTPSSFFGHNGHRGSRHDLNLDDYFVCFTLFFFLRVISRFPLSLHAVEFNSISRIGNEYLVLDRTK